jgi:CMP/dCMP kinase
MTDLINVITVDGPSGAGKGTLTQMLAEHLEWHILDSGALYRILGVACQQAGIELNQQTLDSKTQAQITEVAKTMLIDFKVNLQTKQVEAYLDGRNLGNSIRTDEAGQAASKVAAISSVREVLLDKQKAFVQAPGLVADGRDMGTVVFPDAPAKIFLTASAECRAERRYQQLIKQGVGANMRALLKSIQTRDERDKTRPVAPLVPAADAFVVDSSDLSIDEVFQQAIDFIEEKVLNLSS